MITVAALVLGFALPGLAGGVALSLLSPEPGRAGVLLSRCLASGLVIWPVWSEALARAHVLGGASCWAVSGALAAISLAVLALRPARRILRCAWRDLAYGGAIAAFGLAIWSPVAVVNFATPWGPLESTPWYYWGLAEQIGAAGHIPATSVEWGVHVPFLADYQAFSTASASLIDMAPGDGFVTMRVIMVLVVAASACGVALLALTVGANRYASAAAVPVFLALETFATKLSSYRPEAFAYPFALLAAVLVVDWLRRRDVGALIGCALTVAVLAQVHGILLVVAAAAMAGCVVAFVPRLSFGGVLLQLRRTVLQLLACAAAAVGLAFALGSRLSTENAGGIATAGGDDPTWQFVRAIRALPPSTPPTNWELAQRSLDRGFYGADTWLLAAVAAAVAATLVLASLRRAGQRRSPARRALAFGIAFLLLMGAAAAFLALGWSTYVPRRTGASRLTQLAVVVVPIVVACALSALPWPRRGTERRADGGRHQVEHRSRRVQGRAALTRGGAIAIAAALGGLGALGAASNVFAARTAFSAERPPRAVTDALAHVHLPKGSVVLANGYSEGFIEQTLHSSALLGGRAPYTYPNLLDRANTLLAQGAAFFGDPAAHRDFLVANRVTDVLYVRRGTWDLGTYNTFPANRSQLDAVSYLVPILTLDNVVLYRVQPGGNG